MTSGRVQTAESFQGTLSARFVIAVILILSGYLAIEVLYTHRFPLNVDEYQGAADVLRLADELPYRDFTPYKTVLGYYVQLPVMTSVDDPFDAMLRTRLAMAVLVAITLFIASMVLARWFRPPAVLLALSLLVCMSTFLERSAELRVDMLTAIPGLFALLLLMRGRHVLAGVLCALSFLISQKGIYYIFASEAVFAWMLVRGGGVRRAIRSAAFFSTAVFATIMAYALAWSSVSSLAEIFVAMFINPQRHALGDHYFIRERFWRQILSRDPWFALLAVAAIVLMVFESKRSRRDPLLEVLFPYSIVFFAFGIWHKQPWVYYFVILLPTAFVLHAWLFDRVWTPMRLDPLHRRAIIAVTLLLAVAVPLSRLGTTLDRDLSLQRGTFRLVQATVAEDEEYLAGLRMVPGVTHAAPDVLGFLDTSRNLELLRRREHFHARVVERLRNAPVKAIVTSYRTKALPSLIRDYLASQYLPWWGAVQLYAPTIPCGAFELKFDGHYEVIGTRTVTIDERVRRPGDSLRLRAGQHTAECTEPFRLRWFDPSLVDEFPPGARTDEDLYPSMYDF